jgi:hypothetical protein
MTDVEGNAEIGCRVKLSGAVGIMKPFSDHVVIRANDLHWLAVKPLLNHEKRIVLKCVGYPVDQVDGVLWDIYCAQDCFGTIEKKLQAAGIANEAQAIAYMDEIEPKLRRWAESMAELNDSVAKALELEQQAQLGDVLAEKR